MTDSPINGNLGAIVTVNTETMDWTPSPSGTVWRKRLHLVGPPEAGQVTSVVRYEPDSSFPPHDHPDGEEILVLEGVFSDENGDWPSGSWLLNPEGYRHAPFSRDGCVLFVKLRQAPGKGRVHVERYLPEMPWEPSGEAGVELKSLYRQEGYADTMFVKRWAPGYSASRRIYPDGAEIFILKGSFSDESGSYSAGSWLRLPPGAEQSPCSRDGCEFYIKEGGFAWLHSAE